MHRSVVLLALAACHASGPGAPTARIHELASTIDPVTYATRISGLRATLARSHIEIDTVPVIDTCSADHAGAPGHHHECVRCEVASRENTAGVDPELIDGVALAFAMYPPILLTTTRLSHVALCRTIRIQGQPDEQAPAGIAIFEDRRVLISVEQFVDGAPPYEDFNIQQVVHHEVFHLFDRATAGEAVYADREWHALNPPGFEYRDTEQVPGTRPRGFVNRYATTSELEDRATVFEYLLGEPAKLCEIAHGDPGVAAKTQTVWKRVAKVTGASLLRRHAPCVDWIDKQLPKLPPCRKLRARGCSAT